LFELGKYTEAETSYKKALNLDSTNPVTNNNMALTKLRLGKPGEALNFAATAVQLKPESAEYLYTLGNASEATGNTSSAIQAYEASISRKSNYILPRINLGKIYDEQGSYDKALEHLLKAYQLDSESLAVNNNLGNVYLHSELYTDSIIHYKKAITKKPNATLMRYNLALAYIEIDDKDSGVFTLTQLIKIDASYWDAYYTLGKLMYTNNDIDNAREIFKKLLDKNPDYEKKAEIESLL
jgi:tetratricopeptide (TPR) repeat protein